MKVTLIGTGCPVAHPERGGPATLVETDEAAVLVDCGTGVTQGLIRAGCPGAAVDALLVTHLHSDHVVDFYQLVVSSWHQGREGPWTVFCPETVAPLLEAIMAAYADERAQRIAWEERDSATGLEVDIVIIDPAAAIEIGDMHIAPVTVDHYPVEPAYGFVFRANEKMAVISGDTTVCPALIEAGRGADLLVHEVVIHDGLPPIPGLRTEETASNVARYHTLSGDVGGVARDMAAKALALTHFVPPDFDAERLLAEVGETYDGPCFVGEDGMVFDLATGDVIFGPFRARLL